MAFLPHYFSMLFSLFTYNVCAMVTENQSSNCAPSNCGQLGTINFPFTTSAQPSCGLIMVDGCNKAVQRIQLEKNGRWYEVESTFPSNTLQIRDKILQTYLESRDCRTCKFNDSTLPSLPHITLKIITPVLGMFRCCDRLVESPRVEYNYTGCNSGFNVYYNNLNVPLPRNPDPSLCSILQLPVNNTNISDNIFGLFTDSYKVAIQVSHSCFKSFHLGGQCQLDSFGIFHCANATRGQRKPLVVTATVSLAVGIGFFGVLFCCIRLIFCPEKFTVPWKKQRLQNEQSIEAFLRKHGALTPKRYRYSEVRNMTKSFANKLGEGGYGSVYKGKLSDGSIVAVKVLNESKTESDGEDFINEVAIISKTSHINIVTLLGFCFEGRRRALVYEFMSKGSLEKFIYEENPMKTDCQLSWQTLYRIAVGIARGLEYLHRGCNLRILHFDIKPHNILLNDEFHPKISDFGLAKICPGKESIISKLSARGTAGYIAPEVFCRNFGGVSHKSDVYSYGMLILEMVGGRNKGNNMSEYTSEKCFPLQMYNQLEVCEEFGSQNGRNEMENEYARKMSLVGMWCIQTDPSQRPPMRKVVEMLGGSSESLGIPPKPYLLSPVKSEASIPSTPKSWGFSE